MIRIEYSEHGDRFWLKATGHAGYARYGEDVVCAAVSALMQALALRIEETSGRKVPLFPGEAVIHGYGVEAMEASYTVMCGLRKLEECYPGCVEVAEEHM